MGHPWTEGLPGPRPDPVGIPWHPVHYTEEKTEVWREEHMSGWAPAFTGSRPWLGMSNSAGSALPGVVEREGPLEKPPGALVLFLR